LIEVRRAEAGDIDWLLIQLREFSRFFGTRLPLFGDEAFVRAGLEVLIRDHFVAVAFRGFEQVGFISGIFTPHMYNPAIKVLCETFFWVDPVHRGGSAGARLLAEFMAFGKSEADWVLFTLEHHSPMREETLLRRGFHLHERHYLMEVS
jgi:hypothetical protein